MQVVSFVVVVFAVFLGFFVVLYREGFPGGVFILGFSVAAIFLAGLVTPTPIVMLVLAALGILALVLDQEQGIIDEMNNLGTSSADNKRYDELKEQRTQLYKDAVPYLNSVLELDPEDLSAARTLMNIYSALDDTPNFKAMKAKVDALEGRN